MMNRARDMAKSVKPEQNVEKRVGTPTMVGFVLLDVFTAVLPGFLALFLIGSIFKRRMYDLTKIHALYIFVLTIALAYVMIKFPLVSILYIIGIIALWVYKERIFKSVYKPPKPMKVITAKFTDKFSDKPGYGGAYTVGAIVGIGLFWLGFSHSLAAVWSAVGLAIVFVLLIISQRSIIKDPKTGRYSMFTFSIVALYGFLFGGIMIALMERRRGVFNWILPISILVLAGFAVAGLLLYSGSTSSVLMSTGTTESIPAQYQYIVNFTANYNSTLTGQYTATSGMDAYVLTRSQYLDLTSSYSALAASVNPLWESSGGSGGFSIALVPQNYTILFVNNGYGPGSFTVTQNFTLSR